MSWWPKGAPHEARKIHMYADWEITACLAFADEKIAAQRGDTPERQRLVAWKSGFEAEKVDRIAVRKRHAYTVGHDSDGTWLAVRNDAGIALLAAGTAERLRIMLVGDYRSGTWRRRLTHSRPGSSLYMVVAERATSTRTAARLGCRTAGLLRTVRGGDRRRARRPVDAAPAQAQLAYPRRGERR